MKKKYFINCIRHLVLVVLLATSTLTFSQTAVVTYPVKPQNITVCHGQSLTRIRVDFSQTATAGGTVVVALPPGISYVAGSVVKTAGSTAVGVTDVTITESGGTSSSPQFALSPANILAGSWIEFTFARTASCDARTASLGGTIFKDIATVTVNGTANSPGTSVDTGYTVNFPSFSMVQPATQGSAIIGVPYTRSFTITNGADGEANAVHFTVDYGTSTTQVSLSLAGNPLTPTSIVGSIYTYTLTGTQLGPDAQLTNGESLVFTENYKVTNACNPEAVTTYTTGWGCAATPASWCQSASGTGTAVTSSTGSPNFSNVTLTNLNFVNMCTPWDVRLRLTNGGSGTGTAANMYNVLLQMGMDYYSAQVDFYNSNPSSGYSIYNFRVGTATAVMTLTGPVGDQTLNFDMSQFTTDPDGPGVGLDDLDGDGFYDDLPQNGYIDLTYTYEFICTSACNSDALLNFNGPVVLLQYDTQCGQHFTSNTRGDVNYFGQSPVTSNNTYPPQVDATSGNGFHISLGANLGYQGLPSPPDGTRYVWEVTMPAGVTIASSTQAYTQAGQVVTFTGTNVNFFTVDDMTFNYNCTGGSNLVFNIRLYRINDRFNNCQCRGNLICEDITITAVCAGPCPGGGPWATEPQIRRADNSLGFVDYNLTTHVDPANISDVQLKRALYKHQVQVKGTAVQTSATDNMHLEFVLDKATGGIDKLVPISADVVVKRAGVTIGTCNYTTFDMSGSTPTLTVMDLDLTNCFPSGTILINDEVEVTAIYEVATNNLPTAPTLVAGAKWRFYNYRPDNTKAFCLDWIPQLYLLGTYDSTAFGAYDVKFNGCAVGPNNEMWLKRAYSGDHNLFPGELIPARYYDKMEVTIPAGYEFDHAVYGFNRAELTYPIYIPAKNLVPTTTTATTLTFENDGSWVPALITAEASFYEVRLNVFFRPTCATETYATVNPSYVFTYRDFYYANDVPPVPQIPSASIPQTTRDFGQLSYTYNQVSKPDIVMSNQTGIVQAVRPTESFIVRMASTGQTTAPYNWLALENNPNVTITQVVDVATNAVVPAVAYAGGTIYHLSTTGIASGTFKDYRIDYTYTTCSGATIKAYGGWNCGEFPASPDDYLCNKEELNLTFVTQVAEVEIISVTQPTAPFNLCEGVPYHFDINNAQSANVILNTFTVTVPQGIVPDLPTFEVEYPKNSGNWGPVTVVQTGNVFVLNLFEHPNFPVNGIPGTLLANNTDERQMSIRWNMKTDCSFVSGTKFTIATYAQRGCGEPAVGSSLDVETVSNDIAGADPGYRMLNTFSIASGSFSNCGSPVTIQNSSTVSLSGTTSTNAHILFEIPPGMEYVPGSFACTSTICPTFDSVINLPNGSTAVRLNIPAGLVSSDQLTYTIQVQEVGASTCGDKQFILRTLDAAENLPCATAPDGVCNFVAVQTGIYTQNITVTKPELAITAFGGSVAGNNYTVDVTIANTGTLDQLASNPIVLNYYCADASGTPIGAPIATQTLTNTVLAGAQISQNFSFTASGCSPTGQIVVAIDKATNCVCIEAISSLMDLYPITTNDSSCNLIGQSTVVDVLLNDTTGDTPAPTTVSLVPPATATNIINDAEGDVVGMTISGEGVWSVNPATGSITFTPEAGFVNNPTPVQYFVDDVQGNSSENAIITIFPNVTEITTSTTCSTDGLSYQIIIETTGVAPFTVTGTGAPGVWVGNIWTSDIVTAGTAYTVNITDVNNCNALVVTGVAPVCCLFEVVCPTFVATSVECYGDLPSATTLTEAQFEALGNANGLIGDIPCGVIEITATNSTDTGTCSQSVIITYTVTEYADPNNNGVRDAGEDTVLNTTDCTQTITVQDATAPVFDSSVFVLSSDLSSCNGTFGVIGSGDHIQTNYLSTCTNNIATSGNGVCFLSDGAQSASSGSSQCFFYSPPANVTPKVLGIGNNVVVGFKLSAPLTAGQTYTINLDALNNPGDDGSGSPCPDVIPERFAFGTSSSATVFGNLVGTMSTDMAPSPTYSWSNHSISFVAPNSTDDYLTLQINNQSNDVSVMFLNNVTISTSSDLPSDLVVECDAVPTAETLTATDNCGTASVAYSEATAAGTCAGSYTLTRTWIATDGCGLTTAHVQTITVHDTTAPTFVETLPTDVTVECSAVPVAPTLTATDNCGTASVAYSEATAAGSCAGAYTLTRTWIATDGCGLTATHVQTITVQDTTAPTFVEALPTDVTVECSAVPTAPTLTATDNCGTASVAYSEATAAGSCTGAYTLTRTWIATDACGLSATHVQTITVQDTTAPTFVEILPTNVTVECSAVPTAPTLTATDNCGTATVAYSEATAAGTCAGSYTLTRTWIATDACGLSTTHVQTITVQDTTAPVFVETLPTDVTVECSAVPVAPTLTATDNCGTATVAYTETTAAGSCAGSYTLTRTWIATDGCGLTTAHVQTITVQDTTAPVFVEALPTDVTVECSAVPAAPTLTATDNCGTASVAYSEATAAGSCAGAYTLTRTWIATDGCGLTTAHVQTITVEDTTAPIFVEALPQNVVIACDSEIPSEETLTALDNCSVATVSFDEQTVTGDCIGNYEIIRTWTAVDFCGNSTVHTQTISVRDTTAPAFVEELPQNSFAECDKLPEVPTLTAIDNCGTASVVYSETETAGECSFKYSVIRTWTATDDCGNQNSHVQTIQVACPVVIYNALSPDDDGLNDIFLLDGIDCYPKNRVEIFNRWGVSVFEASGYNNVDKVFKGYSDGRATVSRSSQLPTGTYFYVLSYEYQNGTTTKTIEKSGYLYINSK